MANYKRGTQDHIDVKPTLDVASGECAAAGDVPDVVAVFTRPYLAGANGAAAISGTFEFDTELGATPTGTAVDIDIAANSKQGAAIAGSTGIGGVLAREIVLGDTKCLVAINVTSKTP